MSMNDRLSDMLTRLRNGQQARLHQVRMPASNLLEGVLRVLKDEGYITEYTRETTEAGHSELVVELKYFEGQKVISSIRRVSTPGRRVYANMKTLKPVQNGLGIAILSTSRGVLSDFEARKQNTGGELLCEVS